MIRRYHVIGIMSGTSLDGIDLAYCRFEFMFGAWHYKIIRADTYKYPVYWKKKLSEASGSSALDFSLLHVEYGEFLGNTVKNFVIKNKLSPDFISSHGHTIFHQPENRLTAQIGSGAAIAAKSGLKTVCDFRTLDIALGGQGAPLVPIGDELLFGKFGACLNIGGIANISYKAGKRRIAFDISPANIILNYLAGKIHKDYDDKGQEASKGKIINDLLVQLNGLEFYRQKPPKSLGREWLENRFIPLTELYKKHSICNIIGTVTEHIAEQIAITINSSGTRNVLITGGGGYNDFLIGLIRKKCHAEIILPDKVVIEYKEALIFAFLGVLRMRNETNCLKSVTGAKADNCGGIVYLQ